MIGGRAPDRCNILRDRFWAGMPSPGANQNHGKGSSRPQIGGHGKGGCGAIREMVVGSDVLTADDAGVVAPGGIDGAADDAGVEATGGIAKAAADAGSLITNDISLPSNETTKGRFGKPIPASDDQVVRPTAIARSENGRGRLRAPGALYLGLHHSQ